MKKRMLKIFLPLMALALLCGCKNKDANTEYTTVAEEMTIGETTQKSTTTETMVETTVVTILPKETETETLPTETTASKKPAPINSGSNQQIPPATTPTQPPATEPPTTQPPVTQPPATDPPATQPPATQPPDNSGNTSGPVVDPDQGEII